MCHTTGYYAYCKVCMEDLLDKSYTNLVRCDKAIKDKIDDCGDIDDLRKDWEGFCDACQAEAIAGLNKGDEIDKKWAKGF